MDVRFRFDLVIDFQKIPKRYSISAFGHPRTEDRNQLRKHRRGHYCCNTYCIDHSIYADVSTTYYRPAYPYKRPTLEFLKIAQGTHSRQVSEYRGTSWLDLRRNTQMRSTNRELNTIQIFLWKCKETILFSKEYDLFAIFKKYLSIPVYYTGGMTMVSINIYLLYIYLVNWQINSKIISDPTVSRRPSTRWITIHALSSDWLEQPQHRLSQQSVIPRIFSVGRVCRSKPCLA